MKKLLIMCLTVLTILPAAAQFSMLGHLGYSEDLSDVWGYVDENGNEYALVGVFNGVSVVDVSNPASPAEVFFTPGANSIWRDLKVWGDYAYITNETGGGLMIIDLSPLPQSNNLPVVNFTGGGFNDAHNLFIDENGICYIFGSNLFGGGVMMYDLTADPVDPPVAGMFNDWYVHDGMARGDTLYLAHINDGFFTIVDVSDKNNPVILGAHETPHDLTHNVWVSDDGDYLFTTDEVSGAFLGAYDISNPADITPVDFIQSNPGSGVIPHNVHYINGYLVTSYYADGVTMHDAHRPSNLIEIDTYDTSPFSGSGFNGSWGAYPWLPSGNVLAADIEQGLYVLGATYHRASYLEGMVTDSVCGVPIQNALVHIVSTGIQDSTYLGGNFATGTRQGGTYTVTVSAPGYNTRTFSGITLTPGQVTVLNASLISNSTASVSGDVVDVQLAPINQAHVLFEAVNSSYSLATDNAGHFSRCNLVQGNYVFNTGKWGYRSKCYPVSVSGPLLSMSVMLDAGYYDDFTFDNGWSVTGNAATGAWERGIPQGTTPDQDVSTDCSSYAYVTGNSAGNPGDDDVDNGNTVLTSPVFDLSGITDPWISYYRWFLNSGGSSSTNDTLIVRLSNGLQTVVIEKIYSGVTAFGAWEQHRFRVLDYLTPSATMTISFEVADYGPGHIVEAGIDKFETGGPDVGVEEVSETPLLAYPNPFAGRFSLSSSTGGKIRISDLRGRMVYETAVDAGINEITPGELPAGIYFVSLFSEGRPVQTIRMISTGR